MPYFKMFYHLVWTTKHREPTIVSENRGAIYSAIREKAEKMKAQVFALNGIEDHVHLVTTIPATQPVAEFVRQIKGRSSYVASHLPDATSFQWQTEYAVLTVSESHMQTVIAYVDHRREHHSKRTLHPELERFASDLSNSDSASIE